MSNGTYTINILVLATTLRSTISLFWNKTAIKYRYPQGPFNIRKLILKKQDKKPLDPQCNIEKCCGHFGVLCSVVASNCIEMVETLLLCFEEQKLFEKFQSWDFKETKNILIWWRLRKIWSDQSWSKTLILSWLFFQKSVTFE